MKIYSTENGKHLIWSGKVPDDTLCLIPEDGKVQMLIRDCNILQIINELSSIHNDLPGFRQLGVSFTYNVKTREHDLPHYVLELPTGEQFGRITPSLFFEFSPKDNQDLFLQCVGTRLGMRNSDSQKDKQEETTEEMRAAGYYD